MQAPPRSRARLWPCPGDAPPLEGPPLAEKAPSMLLRGPSPALFGPTTRQKGACVPVKAPTLPLSLPTLHPKGACMPLRAATLPRKGARVAKKAASMALKVPTLPLRESPDGEKSGIVAGERGNTGRSSGSDAPKWGNGGDPSGNAAIRQSEPGVSAFLYGRGGHPRQLKARSPGKRNTRTREAPTQTSPPFPGAAFGLTRATTLTPELKRAAKRRRPGRIVGCRHGGFKPKLHEMANQRMKIFLGGKLLKTPLSDFTMQDCQREAERLA